MMTGGHIAQQRLFNQHIEGEKFQTPQAVVRWMGALQAQDYAQSLWAIASRTRSATVADIEQAIVDRKILRTWPMRGTIHFVPAEDAQWMLKISAMRMIAKDQRRLQQLELDETTIERARELFYHALVGNKRLSRAHIMRLLENAGIRTDGQRGYHLLWYMAQTGLICFGPIEDRQQTFVLLDEWVPASQHISREEALSKLVERYLASHGPATIHDIAGWAGITISDARAGLAAIQSKLLSETNNAHEYWITASSSAQKMHPSPHISLLAGFDEYLLGYKDRSAMLAAEHASKVVPGNNGIFLPMMVVAGLIVGTWQRALRKNTLDIVLKPFVPLPDIEERASEAIKRYHEFLGSPASSITIHYK